MIKKIQERLWTEFGLQLAKWRKFKSYLRSNEEYGNTNTELCKTLVTDENQTIDIWERYVQTISK